MSNIGREAVTRILWVTARTIFDIRYSTFVRSLRLQRVVPRHHLSRRGLLAGAFAASVAALGPRRVLTLSQPDRCDDPFAGGRLVETLRLSGPGARPAPYGVKLGGAGLDTRVFTDLSILEPGQLTVPTSRFFVRTAAPAALAGSSRSPWRIRIGGLVREPSSIDVDALASSVRDLGVHVLECAGNSNPDNFGLMSAAPWAGVPLAELLSKVAPAPGATHVLVSGVDDPASAASGSLPGASWVLPLDRLDGLRAALATRMNGEPLAADHGQPVRLLIPNWYGCCWIKWVDEIRLVGADEPATSQMLEYAARTHQDGRPALARDYRPAVVDQAAMPIRVERWLIAGRPLYRIVGVLWGGTAPVERLAIRTRTGRPFEPVTLCPPPSTNDGFTLWTHAWRPDAPGPYDLVLKVEAPTVSQRRLDLFFYTRRVWIDVV